MKTFEAVFKEGETEGVYGISLVERPAMEDEWIMLSKQKPKLEFSVIEGKKNLLLGAVLIPNKKIYRNIDGHEFYITFTEDTISKLAHSFIKNGYQNNSSIEHEVLLNDVSFVESWQVEDTEKDKSALYGKSYEKGTWVAMAKVSDEIYQEAKNGTFKGFSIDALLGLQEVNFKNDITMNKDDLKSFKDSLVNEIKALFSTSEEKVEETPQEPVAEVEVQPEIVDLTEEITQEQLDAVVSELKSQFETKLSELKTEKDAKITELEAKLAKQPEHEVTVVSPNVEPSTKPTTKKGRIYEFLNNI